MRDLIETIDFFKTLPSDIKESLLSQTSLYQFNSGQILFFENDDLDKIYYLISGAIKFYKVDRFDNEVFLYKLFGPKLIFDLSKMADFSIIQCFANAEFDEDSIVMAIDAQWFKESFDNNSVFMNNVLQESFTMIAQLQCIINRDIVFDGTAKVAHFLATDLETYNRLKKHEIAYMLHIQPETLSRIIKKLTRNEIISIEKNIVKILNMDNLKEIYE
ncbi:MAG: Crp/Fnr family transcriptional regulator [Epsilonproteobacteria bacterium]|nr:Crp/Fnr family transcriptional regulator [Campylobacterota bacterium]